MFVTCLSSLSRGIRNEVENNSSGRSVFVKLTYSAENWKISAATLPNYFVAIAGGTTVYNLFLYQQTTIYMIFGRPEIVHTLCKILTGITSY